MKKARHRALTHPPFFIFVYMNSVEMKKARHRALTPFSEGIALGGRLERRNEKSPS